MRRQRAFPAALLTLALSIGWAAAGETVWKFDNLSRIGGLAPAIEGHPRLVDSPVGKAVQFDGDTALFFPSRPLVGARAFTIEVIFRPEGGRFQQRWLHIAELDPVTGRDSDPPGGKPDPNPRFMYELRVVGDQWYADAYVTSKGGSRTLAFPDQLHPINQWYAVEQTYDGKTYRSYVNGVLQGEGEVGFVPQGAGHVMVGSRLNHVDYFQGSIALARFTDRALSPNEFLQVSR
jgi:hypothetical protein